MPLSPPSDGRPSAAFIQAATPGITEAGYPPTLLQYAEVIAWLDEAYPDMAAINDFACRKVPEHLKAAFDDAIQREALGRVAKAMQAAEDREEEEGL
jgi:hypothetical protein